MAIGPKEVRQDYVDESNKQLKEIVAAFIGRIDQAIQQRGSMVAYDEHSVHLSIDVSTINTLIPTTSNTKHKLESLFQDAYIEAGWERVDVEVYFNDDPESICRYSVKKLIGLSLELFYK